MFDFSTPRKGIHSVRIGPFAAFDLIGTILVSCALSRILGKNVILVFLILMILAETVHHVLKIKTPVEEYVF